MSKVIRINDTNYERLSKMGTWMDTADTLISRLIEESNKSAKVLEDEAVTSATENLLDKTISILEKYHRIHLNRQCISC